MAREQVNTDSVQTLTNKAVTADGGSLARTFEAHFGDQINVLDFSGIDPTGNNDSTTALQAALDEAASARVGEVLIPPGLYRHDSLTLAPSSSQIHVNVRGLGGSGSDGVRLEYVGTGGTAFTISNNTRYKFSNLRVEDGGSGAVGLALNSLSIGSNHGPAIFENVFVRGFTTNIQIGDLLNQAASELLFVHCEVDQATTGVLIQGPVSGTNYSTNIRFLGLQAVQCGTVITTAGDNTGTPLKLSMWGFSFSENQLELDFRVPGMYHISDGYAEHTTSGQFLKSGSATPTANSAIVTTLTLESIVTVYPASPSNYLALLNQPGNYAVRECLLQTGSLQLGGYDGGGGGRKSTLVVESSTLVSAAARIQYRAGSNTVWLVRHETSGNTAVEAVNTDDDRVYVIKTTGVEHNFVTPIPWSSSVAALDAL